MMKKTFGCCVAIFLLACVSAAWGAATREQTYVVGADVNSQGQVTQTQVDADVSKGVASFLDLALKQWQFVPPQQNGVAEAVHTFVKVKLEVIPGDAGKYTLRLSYMRHGPKWDDRPPAYPRDAVRGGTTGMIMLFARMDKDGRFTVNDTRSVLANRSPWYSLEKEARRWLTRLHAIPETVNGLPVGADARVFVNFRLGEVGSKNVSTSDVPFSSDERQLLLDAGFKPPFSKDVFHPHPVTSVLQTRVINPVTMHL